MTGSTTSGHRWSGWPGAWCLDCGIEDPNETMLGCRECSFEDGKITPCQYHQQEYIDFPRNCTEPNSNRCNPYVKKPPLGKHPNQSVDIGE